MDQLLVIFSPTPIKLIIHYFVENKDISESYLKIDRHISICQKEIFDLKEKGFINKEVLEDDDIEISTIRQKINSFIGLRDLISDQVLITVDT